MRYSFSDVIAQMGYYFNQVVECIHFKAFIASLPIVFGQHLLGNWHLFEICFFMSVADLVLGVWLAMTPPNQFSWARLYSWFVKILTFGLTILVVGAVNHAASIALRVYDTPMLDIFMLILILTEAASVLRSATKLGLPVPLVAKLLIEKLEKRAHKKIDDICDIMDSKELDGSEAGKNLKDEDIK